MSTDSGSSSGRDGGSKSEKQRVKEVNPTQNLSASLSQASDPNDKVHTPSTDGGSGRGDGKYISNIEPIPPSASSTYQPQVAPTVSNPQSRFSGNEGGGGRGGGGPIQTDVNQQPAENAPPIRTDFSPVLAAQFKTDDDRPPSRSNNFNSFIGGAGGLGRKTNAAKRTLIGGV